MATQDKDGRTPTHGQSLFASIARSMAEHAEDPDVAKPTVTSTLAAGYDGGRKTRVAHRAKHHGDQIKQHVHGSNENVFGPGIMPWNWARAARRRHGAKIAKSYGAVLAEREMNDLEQGLLNTVDIADMAVPFAKRAGRLARTRLARLKR